MEKKSFSTKLEAFFAGKGFYIVLFLCAAVIGVSAWAMLAENEVDNGDMSLSAYDSSESGGAAQSVSKVTYPTVTEGTAASDEAQTSVPEPEPPAIEETIVEQTPVVDEDTAATFFIWPVNGEIENDYSVDALVYNRTMADWRTHDGIDIAAELGTQVMSATDGTVESVTSDSLYGTTVVINHGGGLRSSYANLAETPTVSVGDYVSAGQVIGSVGATALGEIGEAAHLHFAMSQDGESVDPTSYMP